jgi:hypothetical protein
VSKHSAKRGDDVSTALAQLSQYVRFVAPGLLLTFLYPIVLAGMYQLGRWTAGRQFKRDMHRFGDKKIENLVDQLEAEITRKDARIYELEQRNRAFVAIARGAQIQGAKLAEMLTLAEADGTGADE